MSTLTTLVGTVKSAVVSDYHTNTYGAIQRLTGFKIHVWVGLVNSEPIESKVLELTVYGEVYKAREGVINYIKVRSPIYETAPGVPVRDYFDLHIDKELGYSSVVIYGKGKFQPKYNKQGRPMLMSDLKREFYKIKTPLIYDCWCPEAVNKAIKERSSEQSLLELCRK